MTQIIQGTAEWHEARKGRINASDIAAIMGYDPHRKRGDVLRRMVRQANGLTDEFQGNPATAWGHANEATAAIDFEMDNPELSPLTEGGHIKANIYSGDLIVPIGASPDRITTSGELVEIKCPFSHRAPESGKPEPKEHWRLQVYFQMLAERLATNKNEPQKAYLFVWAPHGTTTEIIEGHQHRLDMVQEAAVDFWKEYQQALLNPQPYLTAKPDREDIDTPEAKGLLNLHDLLTDEIKELEDRKKEVIQSLADLANNKNATICGRAFTLVKKEGAISYANAVKKLLPDADLEPFRGKPTEHWRLF